MCTDECEYYVLITFLCLAILMMHEIWVVNFSVFDTKAVQSVHEFFI